MNRQVPEKIAIIGDGKVARHMIHYFESIGQPYIQWFRQKQSKQRSSLSSRLARFKHKLTTSFNHQNNELDQVIMAVDKVLVLIPDDQIESFITANPALSDKTCIHFSGSLQTELAVGCHPLMTFGPELYDLETYRKIPFVVDEGVNFKELFPWLSNPVYQIKAQHKAIYHAFCVMAGNFSQMLWQSIRQDLPEIGLPADIMSSYLIQNTINFTQNPDNSATGPLVRGDYQTVEKHLYALNNQPLAVIYQAFLDWHLSDIEQQRRKSS